MSLMSTTPVATTSTTSITATTISAMISDDDNADAGWAGKYMLSMLSWVATSPPETWNSVKLQVDHLLAATYRGCWHLLRHGNWGDTSHVGSIWHRLYVSVANQPAAAWALCVVFLGKVPGHAARQELTPVAAFGRGAHAMFAPIWQKCGAVHALAVEHRARSSGALRGDHCFKVHSYFKLRCVVATY